MVNFRNKKIVDAICSHVSNIKEHPPVTQLENTPQSQWSLLKAMADFVFFVILDNFFLALIPHRFTLPLYLAALNICFIQCPTIRSSQDYLTILCHSISNNTIFPSHCLCIVDQTACRTRGYKPC